MYSYDDFYSQTKYQNFVPSEWILNSSETSHMTHYISALGNPLAINITNNFIIVLIILEIQEMMLSQIISSLKMFCMPLN